MITTTATVSVKLVTTGQPTGYKQVSIVNRVFTCEKFQYILESIWFVCKIVFRAGCVSPCLCLTIFTVVGDHGEYDRCKVVGKRRCAGGGYEVKFY